MVWHLLRSTGRALASTATRSGPGAARSAVPSRRPPGLLPLALAGLLALAGSSDALAQRPTSPPIFPHKHLPKRPTSPALDVRGPFLLRADEITYDRDSDTVTAAGNVEISQGQRILLADQVSYDRPNATVRVQGNIRML